MMGYIKDPEGDGYHYVKGDEGLKYDPIVMRQAVTDVLIDPEKPSGIVRDFYSAKDSTLVLDYLEDLLGREDIHKVYSEQVAGMNIIASKKLTERALDYLTEYEQTGEWDPKSDAYYSPKKKEINYVPFLPDSSMIRARTGDEDYLEEGDPHFPLPEMWENTPEASLVHEVGHAISYALNPDRYDEEGEEKMISSYAEEHFASLTQVISNRKRYEYWSKHKIDINEDAIKFLEDIVMDKYLKGVKAIEEDKRAALDVLIERIGTGP